MVNVPASASNFYFNPAPTTLAPSHRRLHTFRTVSAVRPATKPKHCACAGSSVALMTVRAGSTTVYLMSILAGALLARAPVNRLPLPIAGAVLDRRRRGWEGEGVCHFATSRIVGPGCSVDSH
jgi:hypothetical protein